MYIGNLHSKKLRRILALLILVLFTLDIYIMYSAKLQGGDATALIGGTAIFILSLVSILAYKGLSLDKITDNLVKGLQFGFKIFGIVIPIAAFFSLGDSVINDIFGKILPQNSNGICGVYAFELAKKILCQ